MKIAIIGGFLGSGKTTSILKLSEMLTENGQKVAILVNEIGQIGVDGDTISSTGLMTKELTSGCICCSISTSLLATLSGIKKDFDPDILLIEPTGIAFPAQIKANIQDMDSELFTFAPIICLVDGKRFIDEFKQIPRFVINQIAESEIIGINKIDITPAELLPGVVKRLKDINSKAKIMQFSAKRNDEKFQELFDHIYHDSQVKLSKELFEQAAYSMKMSEISTYSTEYSLYMKNIDMNTAKFVNERILQEIKGKVMKDSSLFVGHMKGIMYLSGKIIKSSITSFNESPDSSIYETEDNADRKSVFKILTAVTGMGNKEVQNIVDETVSNVFESENIGFENIISSQPHEHHH